MERAGKQRVRETVLWGQRHLILCNDPVTAASSWLGGSLEASVPPASARCLGKLRFCAGSLRDFLCCFSLSRASLDAFHFLWGPGRPSDTILFSSSLSPDFLLINRKGKAGFQEGSGFWLGVALCTCPGRGKMSHLPMRVRTPLLTLGSSEQTLPSPVRSLWKKGKCRNVGQSHSTFLEMFLLLGSQGVLG